MYITFVLYGLQPLFCVFLSSTFSIYFHIEILSIHVGGLITLGGHRNNRKAGKYGETAGITCLTLQPVLALVSMNMTFSSLALCSPSSIMICLQDNQARLITKLKDHLFSTDMLLLTTRFLLSSQNIFMAKTT